MPKSVLCPYVAVVVSRDHYLTTLAIYCCEDRESSSVARGPQDWEVLGQGGSWSGQAGPELVGRSW